MRLNIPVLVALFCNFLAPLASASEITIRKHGWTEDGDLVLGVRIKSVKKALQLGRHIGSGEEESEDPFTTARFRLLQPKLNQVLEAKANLPRRPFFGTMSAIITLKPGDSMTFGVAFPPPKTPPATPEGEIPDYELILEIPHFEPIKFTIPHPKPGNPPRTSASP